MDLLAIGTPVIDLFARASEAQLKRAGLRKGATNLLGEGGFARVYGQLAASLVYRYPGDNARNVCEGFAALGGSCAYSGCVGRDEEGEEFEKSLSDCGVGRLLAKKNGSTGKILALVSSNGHRTFAAQLGVSSCAPPFEKKALSSCKLLFLTSITVLVKPIGGIASKYLEEGKRAGKKIALSLESPPMVEKNRGVLLEAIGKYADVLFLNEQEAAALLGRRWERKLAALKPSCAIFLKRGKKGSTVIHEGNRTEIGAIQTEVVDTTGAGDAYAAGVLYGISHGYGFGKSAKLGCKLSTAVVGKMGAGLPEGKWKWLQ